MGTLISLSAGIAGAALTQAAGGHRAWWESYERAGFDPIHGVEVTANRRRIRIELELPIKDAYRRFMESLVSEPSQG